MVLAVKVIFITSLLSFLTCFTRGLWLPPFQQFDCSVRCCHHVWVVQLFYTAQRISTDYGIGLIPLLISFKMCVGEIMISQCLLTLRAPFSCPYIPQQVVFMLTLVLLMVMALTGYNVLFSVLILMPFIPKCPSSSCEGFGRVPQSPHDSASKSWLELVPQHRLLNPFVGMLWGCSLRRRL